MANENLVGYPTGGITAIALRGAASPSKVQMADPNFAITSLPGWLVVGLRAADGGPQWNEEPATPEETYEEGYKFSPQNGSVSCTQTLVEQNPAVLSLLRGVTYVDGVADIDIDRIVECKVYTEDRLRTKTGDKLERFMAPRATVTGLTSNQKSRGSMANRPITITADRADELEGRAHYRHAIIDADDTPEPVILAVTPAGQAIGEQVVISGRHFTGMSGVTIDGNAVVSPILAGDDMIVATIPAGSVGEAEVIVTTADGTSEPYTYTVGV
ncbi:MAG TPA: IPT/TIG domain-containing protein [Propionicimonas sp.]|nr:IPT/TIG domain-containing protein [Propionicimonas sp.]